MSRKNVEFFFLINITIININVTNLLGILGYSLQFKQQRVIVGGARGRNNFLGSNKAKDVTVGYLLMPHKGMLEPAEMSVRAVCSAV